MLKRVLPFVPILVLLMFGACSSIPEGVLPEGAGTFVVQTLTATMWTPTVTPTPDPDTSVIVDTLNSGIIAADSLRYTVVAKFNVLDVQFPMDEVSHKMMTMQIDVDCSWIYTDSCTPEETFAIVMDGFIAKKAIDKIQPQVPSTVDKVYVTTFKHMVRSGVIIVNWKDLVEFAAGKITGNQLGARITRP